MRGLFRDKSKAEAFNLFKFSAAKSFQLQRVVDFAPATDVEKVEKAMINHSCLAVAVRTFNLTIA